MYVVCLIFAILALAKETNSYKLLRHRRAAGAITGSTHSVNNNLALSASEFDDDNDMNGAGSGQFTRKQILKEETESPFRAVRYFGYISLGSAAALSSFITLTSIAAVSSGARQGDMNELINNMGINLAGLVTMGYLWNREQKSQNSQLQRISKGGKLAQLKLKCKDPITNESIVCKLSDFRRDRGFEKKVIIIAAPKSMLVESLKSSFSQAEFMEGFMIVPIAIEEVGLGSGSGNYRLSALSSSDFNNNEATEAGDDSNDINTDSNVINDINDINDLNYVGAPVALSSSWDEVVRSEVDAALAQRGDALEKGFTLQIAKNGKVGSRKFGVPLWEPEQ